MAQRPDDFHLEQISEQLTEHLNREMELPSVVSSDLSTKVSYFERANFRVDFHASQISNNNNRYCGDSFEYFMDSKGFAHIILSDGMGSGAVSYTHLWSINRIFPTPARQIASAAAPPTPPSPRIATFACCNLWVRCV